MSFWEANRGLVAGAILALLLAAIMHFLVAGARRSQARDLERQAAELQAQIDKLDRGAPAPDMAAPEALKAIKAERAELDKVLKRTGGLLLTLPPEYVLPKNAPDKQLIFERQLSELRARCVEGRDPKYDQSKPQSCPLGFTRELQDRESSDLEMLFQRLAAARRLMAAADAANLARVLSISHGKAATLGSPGVSKMHLRLLPLNLRGVADEKSLVTFIQEISREGSFLGLESLEVEVTDPKAKTFNIKAGLLALVAMEGPGKAGGPGQSGPTPPSIGRY